jgi:membrane associated rhomboid family serine protease
MIPLTTWVRRLLIANIAMYFITAASPQLMGLLILYPPAILLRPWTVVSYMFLHGGLGHLFFNMIGLFFFGPRLESRLGGRDFLWLYFLSGAGGAVFSIIFATQYPVVGASGAVYGVLLGYALFWPREKIYIYGILPVEAWLLASLLVFGSLYSGLAGSASRTAHFAHLGGLAFAFAFVRWREWKRGEGKRAFQKAMNPRGTAPGLLGDRAALARWKGIGVTGLHQLNRDEVVRLLNKVESSGVQSLTPPEREFLDRMSAG